MRYGACASTVQADVLRKAGFDFLELNVQTDLVPLEDRAAYLARLDAIRSAGLPCLSANCFIPGGLKITGESPSTSLLDRYVRTAFSRAEEAGIRTVVFGSGAARALPEGFDREKGRDQIVSFLVSIAGYASDHGVTVVVEPLNRNECNVLNTVSECAEVCAAVARPSVRLLVDSFHWFLGPDDPGAIIRNGGMLSHVHVGTVPGRKAPGLESCDWSVFADALDRAGYGGPIAVEAGWTDMSSEGPLVLRTMKGLFRIGGDRKTD